MHCPLVTYYHCCRSKMSGHGGCVVVTGAASGIGRAISMELASQGFVTALWDIDKVSMGSPLAWGKFSSTYKCLGKCTEVGYRAWCGLWGKMLRSGYYQLWPSGWGKIILWTSKPNLSHTVGCLQSGFSLGPIKCLVNNAGINLGPCLFKNEPKEVFNKQYEKS